MENAAAWIWFQQTFGRGTLRASQVLEAYGHPGQILGSSHQRLALERVLRPPELAAVNHAAQWEAQEILHKCQSRGDLVLTQDMEEYPRRLLEIPCPPAALFVQGNPDVLHSEKAIALVGSRNASAYGLQAARMLAAELVALGAVVVSGFADGIDEASHQAALERGGTTVAVLGCGLDVDYPSGRSRLRAQTAAHGALISEYPLGSPPVQAHFPVRNRIISGLCQGVVVVEGAMRSGSLVTARLALEQGRDVFAVPGNVFSPLSAAPNSLIKRGEAKLITCALDILEEYPYLLPDTISNKQSQEPQPQPPALEKKRPEAPAGLTGNQLSLFHLLEDEPVAAQDLIISSGLPAKEVLAALTQLEIYGAAQSYPGKRYGLPK